MGMGNISYPQATQGGQPQFGQPNRYSNTVQPWDNATIAPQSGGKGGGKGQSNYPVMPTSYSHPAAKGQASVAPTNAPPAKTTVAPYKDDSFDSGSYSGA